MFSCVVRRERHCKQISLACVGGSRSAWTTLGLPSLQVACAFWVYTAQAPGCSVGHRLNCPCVLCTSQVYAAQVHLLRHSARAQTRLGLRFVPFPGPSSSGRQLLGEFTVPGVPCVSRGELTSGCEPPDRCQPSRIPGRRG